MRRVKTWKCPECGITYDASNMFVPEVTTGYHTCDHCTQHGWGENELEVLEYKDKE